MSERPWLEITDPALRAERELLKRLNSEQPPAGSVDHGWAALSGEIAGLQVLSALSSGATDTAHTTAHAAAGSSGFALAAKVVAGVALAGGAWWSGHQLVGTDTPAVMPPRPTEQLVQSVTPPRVESPAPVTSALPAPEAAPPVVNAPRPATSTTLAEEGRLLSKARQLVHAGQGRQALEVLRASEARYPRSVLFQEREVVTIEALGATGAAGAARQRAERFLKRYPDSPYAGRLQRFVE